MCTCMHYGTHVEVKGQDAGLGSLLPPYGSRDGTPVRLGGKHLHPLSHLSGPALLIFLMISDHILIGDEFLAEQISVTVSTVV